MVIFSLGLNSPTTLAFAIFISLLMDLNQSKTNDYKVVSGIEVFSDMDEINPLLCCFLSFCSRHHISKSMIYLDIYIILLSLWFIYSWQVRKYFIEIRLLHVYV